jgi:hypothetical protein
MGITGARRQKVIAEYTGADWLVLFHSGRIAGFQTAAQALTAIQRIANRGNRTLTVTTIEWRNAPAGFTPPTTGA